MFHVCRNNLTYNVIDAKYQNPIIQILLIDRNIKQHVV